MAVHLRRSSNCWQLIVVLLTNFREGVCLLDLNNAVQLLDEFPAERHVGSYSLTSVRFYFDTATLHPVDAIPFIWITEFVTALKVSL